MVARCKLGCTRFSRCCYLIIDLYSPLSKGSWARTWSQSPDLGGRARLFGYHLLFSLLLLLSQRNFEPGSLRSDDRELRRPLASPVLWGVLPSRPRRASLSGYCAVVRTPPHSPTNDAAGPPAFSPPQQRLASLHFSLLALQVLAPISADHCPLQRVPRCSAPPAPAWSSNNGLLLC